MIPAQAGLTCVVNGGGIQVCFLSVSTSFCIEFPINTAIRAGYL